jgi:cobalt-zinc-cadmium efflux system membrane fusion protein
MVITMSDDLENESKQNDFALDSKAWSVRKQIRFVLYATAAVVAGLVLSWASANLRSTASHDTKRDSAAAAAPLYLSSEQLAELQVITVETMPFHSEEIADGRIALNADTATQVFSPYTGRVTRLIVGIGEHVAAGAPLMAVEASEFVQAQGDLLNAVSQLKLSRINEERRRAAYDAKGGSLQDWQQAQADLVTAESTLTLARNRLRILGKTDQEIVRMERADSTEQTAYVTAPIAGVVTDRQVGPGQFLQAGSSTPLYTIGDISTVWLVANVREAVAPLIEAGQSVEVRVLALPDRVFKATLTSIGTSVDPVTRRVPVRATIANPDGKLRPEMFASFTITTSRESTAPAVPEESVIREGDTARLWVIEPDSSLALRSIRTGRVSDGMVEVLEGVSPGERVVTRGALFIDRAAHPT